MKRLQSKVRFAPALLCTGILAIAAAWCWHSAAQAADEKAAAPTAPAGRLYEMRTYTTLEGRLEALKTRFRDHTNRLFVKHGITPVAYWTPTDEVKSKNTLIYVLSYPDKDAHAKAWAGFRADPDWRTAREASERDGKIVEKIETVMMMPTDFSPLK